MRRLRLTPEAELDVDAAHLWYHRQAPERAVDFLAAINACFALIQRHPRGFPLIDSGTRRALVRRFPYAVFYEIEVRQIESTTTMTTKGGIVRRGGGLLTREAQL